VEELFTQLMGTYRINDVRQTEISTVEPLVPQESLFGVEIDTGKFILKGSDDGVSHLETQLDTEEM
jgi:hypothetical protein